jgi:SAM-dependent methyltransferase
MVQESKTSKGEAHPFGHWAQMASHWAHVGPPLRPSPEDTALFQDIVQTWTRTNAAPRVLMLGVTPEIYQLAWPVGTDIIAVDRARSMIENIWPGSREAAICSDWLDMEPAEASRDMVFCDGGLCLLAYPSAHQRLANLLHTILAPGGLCILRLFVPPLQRETPGAVIEDLVTGKIANLNILKLRLWAALQDNTSDGVALADVWRIIKEAAGDLEAFAKTIGWPVEQMLTINAYRDMPTCYHLITADEVTEVFGAGGAFRISDTRIPSYEYGDRCPILTLTRQGS